MSPYAGKGLFDIEFGIPMGDAVTLSVGAQNLLNTYPPRVGVGAVETERRELTVVVARALGGPRVNLTIDADRRSALERGSTAGTGTGRTPGPRGRRDPLILAPR